MSAFFTSNTGNDVFLNLSRTDRTSDDTTDISKSGSDALALIKSAPPSVPLSAAHFLAADKIYDEGICISPYTIFQHPVHRDICTHINNISDFGWSVREALDEAGAFEFIEKVQNRSSYDSCMERILSVFTMSATGLACITDAPKSFFHAVVDVFRTSDGADWNRELLGKSEVYVQCVSNLIRGLAKITGDDTLLEKARKHRRASVGQLPGFHAFQYSKVPLDQELLRHVKLFLKESKMRPADVQSAARHMSAWLAKEAPGRSLEEMVFDTNRPKTFADHTLEKNGGTFSRATFVIVDAARKLSISITEQFVGKACGRTMFDLVTKKEHSKLKGKLKKLPKPDISRARPLSEKLVPIVREILEEGVNGWPGNSGRFHERVVRDGKEYSIFCPVIPTLLLVMLEIPLRMGQIRRLDTGEGDAYHFNADKMEWEKNEGPLAGYWRKKLKVGTSTTDTCGYAREIEDEVKPVVGMNITTNKTGKPYVVPWFLPRVHKLLWELRKWQEKHNPISVPITPKQYVDSLEKVPASTLEAMPDIFPIARLFRGKYHTYDGRVVTQTQMHRAWGYVLQETQKRWNARHPGNQVKLVEIHPKSKQPGKYLYTIHGLRVRGLTNLHRGGMPLELLSKFVAGHATVRMTSYYLKLHAIEVSNIIERAAANMDAQRRFIDDLKAGGVDRAHEMAVSLSPAAVSDAYEDESQFSFCNVTLGVCPYDGSRCKDGGELLRKEGKGQASKDHYGEVKNRNCVMCRHFLTGPPFLMELVAYGNKLCERRQFLAREQDRILQEVSGYEVAHKNGDITRAYFENRYDSLQTEAIQVRDELEENENSIFNVEILCNASQRLLDEAEQGEKKVLLVASPRSSNIEYEEISEFNQSVWITAHGRIHRILGDERVERKRDRYLNLIAENSGLMPPTLLTRITDEQRRRAMDQYANFIDARVPADDVTRLINGNLRLQDLGLEKQVRELIDSALSSAVPLLGTARIEAQVPERTSP
ncbi:VPA1269 family protein [Rhizobium binxianense]